MPRRNDTMNNDENVRADVKDLRRNSVFLDSRNFDNPPGNAAIFEAKPNEVYKLREQLELRDSRGYFAVIKPGQSLKLTRVEHGCAYFDVLNDKKGK